MKLKICILTLVIILFAGQASAFKSNVILNIRTEGFTLDRKKQRDIEIGVNAMYNDFRKLFNIQFRNNPTFNYILFATKEAYQKRARKLGLNVASNYPGFFHPYGNRSFTWNSSFMTATIFHESAHRLVSRKIPRCPIWLNEGLASYYENVNVNNGAITIPFNLARNSAVKKWLNDGDLPSLTEFFTLLSAKDSSRGLHSQFYSFNIKGYTHAGYTITGSLIYFLMSSDEGKKLLKAFADNVASRIRHRVDTITVINKSYSGGIHKLESDWHKWVKQPKANTIAQ